jgi:glutathione S-transferase
MFGQVGFFNKFAGKAYEDKRPRDRYATESARLLGVLDEWLAGRDWVMGADYSIADISLLGWVEAVPERTPASPSRRWPAPCCGSVRSAAPCGGWCIEGAIATPHTPLSSRA